MHKVRIQQNELQVEDGTLLSELLMQNRIPLEHPCGGRGSCKKCTVIVNGKEELSCRYRIEQDITVEIPEQSGILSETGASESNVDSDNMCFVLDIGTTTLAMALVSLDHQCVVRQITKTNPQRAYGADVINRISYCMEQGIRTLHSTLLQTIREMISQLHAPNSKMLYVAGNTTMLHTFFDVDCSSLGTAPYTAQFLSAKRVTGDSMGLAQIDFVESLPCISAFVGADLVAGLNAVKMPIHGRFNLLIDLGTNAEILLFNEDSVLCTAAAAGPCFEGANIACGMSAMNGAVYAYSDHGYQTIGNAEPCGICGTGLIDVIATLLRRAEIDETGYMECEEFFIHPNVYLSQNDIRQFQLAKSAVYSAVCTLMQMKNVTFDDIDTMYISGGFSAKINVENAVYVGLLPRELQSKCTAIQNSCLSGTVRYAIEHNNLTPIIDHAVYADLSGDSVFADLFIENMMFE